MKFIMILSSYVSCINRFLEVRGVDEIDYTLSQELNPTSADAGPSSSTASIVHAKPSRPGKGKVKVAKFQA
jgi:hypothetical protein